MLFLSLFWVLLLHPTAENYISKIPVGKYQFHVTVKTLSFSRVAWVFYRNSRQEVFCKKVFLKISQNVRKRLYQSLLFSKVAASGL